MSDDKPAEPDEGGEVKRGSETFEKAFSEQRGINVVNFAPPTGVMPEPGGLPAATGTPPDAPPPPQPAAESASTPAAPSSTEE